MKMMPMSELNTSVSIVNVFGLQHCCGADHYVILSDHVQLCTLNRRKTNLRSLQAGVLWEIISEQDGHKSDSSWCWSGCWTILSPSLHRSLLTSFPKWDCPLQVERTSCWTVACTWATLMTGHKLNQTSVLIMCLTVLCLVQEISRLLIHHDGWAVDRAPWLHNHLSLPPRPLRCVALHDRDGRLQWTHLHDRPHQGHCPHFTGGHAKSSCGQERGAELLHLCNDQGLHEEGGVCEPAPGCPSGQWAWDQGLLCRSCAWRCHVSGGQM